MRIISTSVVVALSLGVALAAPISALAADGAHPFHKHAVQPHRVAHAGALPSATALVPTLPAPANDADGLSRNSEDCNRGCIDH
jgi:hypothetical protein